VDVIITDQMKLELAGTIDHIVEDQVIIKASQPGTSRVLDDGTIIAFENRQVLGRIYETFGPIAAPLHSIRFNVASDIDGSLVTTGTKVYFVPDYSVWTLTAQLARLRGCDASNMYDEEVDANVCHTSFFCEDIFIVILFDFDRKLNFPTMKQNLDIAKRINGSSINNSSFHCATLRNFTLIHNINCK
jgi:rRNA processing protein Gar1